MIERLELNKKDEGERNYRFKRKQRV